MGGQDHTPPPFGKSWNPGEERTGAKRILQQNSVAQHWARDWRALALTQVHHGSRLSDSCEDGEALSSVHPPTPATGKLIHNLLCDCRVKNDRDTLLLQPQPILSGPSHLIEVLGPRQLVL